MREAEVERESGKKTKKQRGKKSWRVVYWAREREGGSERRREER